jgi:hypothetical protein
MPTIVVKRTGERVPFDEQKLVRSLQRAGAGSAEIQRILSKTNKILYDGITTKKIFEFVFKELKQSNPAISSKYNLKKAIINLGKSGFVFEKYIARLFEQQGYKTRLNAIVKGKFVEHEIDISAQKNGESLMIECKHHTKPWLGCHIDVALATYARFLDVQKNYTKPVLVTNTKFTTTVIKYAQGTGLGLIGWKYPATNSLEKQIEDNRTYPITVLNIPSQAVNTCLKNNVLTVIDTARMNPEQLSHKTRINKQTATNIIEQSRQLLNKK